VDDAAKQAVLDKIRALMDELDAKKVAASLGPVPPLTGEPDGLEGDDTPDEPDEPESAVESGAETPADEEEEDGSDLAKLRALAGKGK
jgi:hypothetical protein